MIFFYYKYFGTTWLLKLCKLKTEKNFKRTCDDIASLAGRVGVCELEPIFP